MTYQHILSAIAVILLTATSGMAGETTLVTYYPAPTGSYNQLTVKDALTLTSNTINCASVASDKTLLGYQGGRLASCRNNQLYFPSALDAASYSGGTQLYPQIASTGTPASAYYLNLTSPASFGSSPTQMNGLGYAAGELKLFTADTQAMAINSAGDVAIAKTLTADKMNITGDASAYKIGLQVNGRIITGDANHTGGVWLDNRPSLFIGEIDNTRAIGLFNNGWRFRLESSGNVGIGVAGAPQATLDVVGDQKITGTITSMGGVILPPTANGCAGADNCLWIAP